MERWSWNVQVPQYIAELVDMCKVGVFLSLRKKKCKVQICKWVLWKLYFKMLYIVGSDQKGSEHTGSDFSLMLHINGLEGSYCPRDHIPSLSTMQLLRGLSLCIISLSSTSLYWTLILLAEQAYSLLRLWLFLNGDFLQQFYPHIWQNVP